jgi:YidC/Oxa1 family membrane protein insertase
MRRFLITTVAILIGLSFAAAVFFGNRNTQQQQQPSQQPTAQQDQPAENGRDAQPSSDRETASTEGQPPRQTQADRQSPPAPTPADGTKPVTELEPIEGLQVANEAAPNSRTTAPTLGSSDEQGPYNLELKLSWWGGSIQQLTLAKYDTSVRDDSPYVLLKPLETKGPRGQSIVEYAYAANWVQVNGGKLIDLKRRRWQYRSVEVSGDAQAGEYAITLSDGDGNPVLDIVRRYVVEPESYDVQLHQRLVNRTDGPLNVQFRQSIQGDIVADKGAYLGDRRMFFTGFRNLASRQGRSTIFGNDYYRFRTSIIETEQIWPNPEIDNEDADVEAQLMWLASTNRYFAIATHALVTPQMQKTADLQALTGPFPQIQASVQPPRAAGPEQQIVQFRGQSRKVRLAAGDALPLHLGFYAGPRDKEAFSQRPASLLNLDELRLYSMGGPIGSCCTFPWLASFLLWFLKLIEGQVLTLGGVAIGFFDWGVAIIVLVAVVRLILHPLTKKSQANMMKMSKQMQALQPEVEKIKKKYKDDQQKMNQEMMKLYREKGINPAGMLGCLPMVLQMPIWVALYAMLYFAIELRHEPAFYGVFQHLGDLFGVYWPFLADLSRADQFIKFPGGGFTLTWLPIIQPHFGAINILPILMAVVFYFQQKFTTPPPTSEQAAQQQKIMKFMILLFPIMLYSAPSGLTLYILASTAAGVVDSYIVRKHVREQEEAGTLFEKKPPKPGGLRDRIQKAVEQKQQELQAAQQGGGGKGGKAGGNAGGSPGTKRVKSKSRKR